MQDRLSLSQPGSQLRRRTTRSALLAAAVALAVAGSLGAPASADPGRVAEVSAQVNQLSNEASHAGERANGARVQLAAAEVRLASVQAELAAARAELDAQRGALTDVVRELYVNGGMDTRLISFALDDPGNLVEQLDQLEVVSSGQAQVVAGARSAAEKVQEVEAAEAKERAEMEATAAQLADELAAVTAKLNETEALLSSLQAEERARLEAEMAAQQEAQRAAAAAAGAAVVSAEQSTATAAQVSAEVASQEAASAQQAAAAAQQAAQQAAAPGASASAAQAAQREAARQAAAAAAAQQAAAAKQAEAARQAAAAAAAEAARKAAQEKAAQKPATSAPAPSSNGGSGAAVSYALSQVGKGYVLGGTGPSSYDCSGLTMMAWRNAGVSLPHFSGSQYQATRAVPTSQIQPGDLLFFYSISTHVGMYIGNGQFVHAANPSRGVVVDSLNSYYKSNLVAASRP